MTFASWELGFGVGLETCKPNQNQFTFPLYAEDSRPIGMALDSTMAPSKPLDVAAGSRFPYRTTDDMRSWVTESLGAGWAARLPD